MESPARAIIIVAAEVGRQMRKAKDAGF